MVAAFNVEVTGAFSLSQCLRVRGGVVAAFIAAVAFAFSLSQCLRVRDGVVAAFNAAGCGAFLPVAVLACRGDQPPTVQTMWINGMAEVDASF